MRFCEFANIALDSAISAIRFCKNCARFCARFCYSQNLRHYFP
ncbi:hypothetical protein [Helicobacter sp. 23-1045]